MALSAVLQSFFILVIVLLYTATVWRSLDSYFRDEFKKHLEKDYKSIQKLKRDRLETVKENVETKKVVHTLDEITSELTEETIQQLSAEVPNRCMKEKHPVTKYGSQDEVHEEDYIDNGNTCPFTPNTDIQTDGGG